MERAVIAVANKPIWVDLATPDAEASREFYSQLFGWQMDLSADPQYGGYATAKVGGLSAAGIGPKQSEQQPTVWSLYIGTDDVDALSAKVASATGTVVMPPFDVGDQGRMAVFQDPSGAFISAWQPLTMSGFATSGPNAFGWAELNARGVDQVIPFYERVFGWKHRTSPIGEGLPPYNEFLLDGESILGAWEMAPTIPPEVPSYWQVYFSVADVEAMFKNVLEAGGRELVSPSDYPGGRFAIVIDPHGASFGLIEARAR